MIASAESTRRPLSPVQCDAMATTLPPDVPWPLLRLQDSILRKRRWWFCEAWAMGLAILVLGLVVFLGAHV